MAENDSSDTSKTLLQSLREILGDTSETLKDYTQISPDNTSNEEAFTAKEELKLEPSGTKENLFIDALLPPAPTPDNNITSNEPSQVVLEPQESSKPEFQAFIQDAKTQEVAPALEKDTTSNKEIIDAITSKFDDRFAKLFSEQSAPVNKDSVETKTDSLESKVQSFDLTSQTATPSIDTPPKSIDVNSNSTAATPFNAAVSNIEPQTSNSLSKNSEQVVPTQESIQQPNPSIVNQTTLNSIFKNLNPDTISLNDIEALISANNKQPQTETPKELVTTPQTSPLIYKQEAPYTSLQTSVDNKSPGFSPEPNQQQIQNKEQPSLGAVQQTSIPSIEAPNKTSLPEFVPSTEPTSQTLLENLTDPSLEEIATNTNKTNTLMERLIQVIMAFASSTGNSAQMAQSVPAPQMPYQPSSPSQNSVTPDILQTADSGTIPNIRSKFIYSA
jgi:hypothetical protein